MPLPSFHKKISDATHGEAVQFDVNDSSGLDESLYVAEPLKSTIGLSNSTKEKTSTAMTSIQSFLQTVPHLYTLTAEQIEHLHVKVREYGEMNVIIEEGVSLEHVYVLASGTVEVMNSKKGLKRALGHRRVGSITAPNVFGIDDIILGSPAEFTYHASSEATLFLIPKDQFLALFAVSPIFANSVSSRILQTLPSFALVQDFCRAIFGLSSTGNGVQTQQEEGYRLSLPTIANIFQMTGCVIHKHANKKQLDAEALRFCVRRLPVNITETFVIILTSSLPEYLLNEFLADAVGSAQQKGGHSAVVVNTGKRRRCAWSFGGGGQTLIMMRDGFTDIIDFMSNLSIFTIECCKMRTRLKEHVSPSAAEILRDAINNQRAGADFGAVLSRLHFDEVEIRAITEAWGDKALISMYNIMLHREEYVVRVERPLSKKFAQDAYFNWSLAILRHVKAKLRVMDDEDLPPNTRIDLLFSPNRTLKNLFCSMANEFKELVVKKKEDAGVTGTWKNEEDRYYYILTGLLENETTIRDAYRARLESNGFTLMEDAHWSALIVDLIDIRNISVDDMDSALQSVATKARKAALEQSPHFIINVDKAFGGQIEAILRSLLLAFGNVIRSVNITGKAGGLAGNRGDVVLPSKLLFSKQSFGEDSTDEIRLCNTSTLTPNDIAPFFGKSCSARIFRGACITLPGVILHSEPVLKFYKTVHGCTALEMQSSYVARQLEECRRTGVLTKTIASRYLFYCDDMPLGNEDGSVLKPKKREIISTIYASARAIISRILDG